MNLIFREALESDLAVLVGLLAADELGIDREDTSLPINQKYVDALHCIEQDRNNSLTVVEANDEVVGMLQLTYIPYLTHTGSKRCLIEGVRVSKNYRGKGLGSKMIKWAISQAKSRNCSIVQLTSNKGRPEALRFYRSLGFEATHEGFKLAI